VHIHHLRRRLTEARAGVGIETIRGVGYVLRDETA
jgi:DNA-binding response OmpR family regulator